MSSFLSKPFWHLLGRIRILRWSVSDDVSQRSCRPSASVTCSPETDESDWSPVEPRLPNGATGNPVDVTYL